jgi:intracellular sulfur oxidation DsrE/DsrF family protein
MISHTLNVFRLLLLATALTLPATPVGAQDDAEAIVKVVYHADFADPRRFSAMLTSINNMVTFYQNELIDYDVRIVFVAHGIRFLTSDKLKGTPFSSDAALEERRDNLRGRLSSLNSVQDVKLELCDITRTGISLSRDALYKGVELVPSGVVRIADLQTRGYAYIKIE